MARHQNRFGNIYILIFFPVVGPILLVSKAKKEMLENPSHSQTSHSRKPYCSTSPSCQPSLNQRSPFSHRYKSHNKVIYHLIKLQHRFLSWRNVVMNERYIRNKKVSTPFSQEITINTCPQQHRRKTKRLQDLA